jgi:thymidylate synthase
MAFALNRETIIQAWLDGMELLLQQPGYTAFNVVLDIASPLAIGDQDRTVLAKVDQFLAGHGKNRLQTVANTIFPESLYRRYGTEGVFQVYPTRVYPVLKKDNRWGTYVYRMVRREDSAGKVINPLERVIAALKTESQSRNPKRSRYELGMTEPFTDISIADPTLPFAKQAIGGPCLSHLSFKLDPASGQVRLIAFYRSHYYVERALGNLVGLARLLSFVANEVGLEPGPLTCISSYAQIDVGQHWRRSEVCQLVSECKRMLTLKDAAAA